MRTKARAGLLVGVGLTIVTVAPLGAETPRQLVEEVWEAAHVEGVRVGYQHTTVRQVDLEGAKRLRATAELDLTFKRNNAVLHLRREQGTEETPEGKVVGVFMRQGQDGGRQLVLTGTVEDGQLHVRVDNGRIDRRIPWNDEVVGLHRLEHLFAERKPKPGDHFTLLRYEPTYNAILTLQIAVKDREEVTPSPGAPRVALLRVEMTAEPLEGRGVRVQPPPVVWWLDDKFVPVRRQFELDGLGTVVLTRTTREAATAAPAPGRLTDIGLKTLLPLNRTLPNPYATLSVVYRITLRGDSDPGSALAQDDHQDVRNLRGETFELHVHPVRRPLTPHPSPPKGRGEKETHLAPGGKAEKDTPLSPRRRGAGGEGEMAEYLQSCPFINCDDSRVQELARRAVGDEKEPWARARRVERWVKQSMRPDNTVALGPASDVARQLRGDCRQYALLTAALCRAAGIPARTAVGLLYVEKGRKPQMGFHMWTEVCIDGQWLGLDGTLGLGGVSAAHVKISDHSWQDTHSLTPLLPANRILGKMTISVLRVEGEE
jgi:hypothetical protein